MKYMNVYNKIVPLYLNGIWSLFNELSGTPAQLTHLTQQCSSVAAR